GQQPSGQRLQPQLPGRRSPRPPLGPERPVQILQPLLRLRRPHFPLQLGREMPLLGQPPQHVGPPLLQSSGFLHRLRQRPELRVVHAARPFFAVAGDEGHGVARVQQRPRRLHVPPGPSRLPCEPFPVDSHGPAARRAAANERYVRRRHGCVVATSPPSRPVPPRAHATVSRTPFCDGSRSSTPSPSVTGSNPAADAAALTRSSSSSPGSTTVNQRSPMAPSGGAGTPTPRHTLAPMW